VSSPIGVKTKPIFQFGALKKDKLSLKKFMPPKGQFGVLSYRGPEGCYANKTKPIFQSGALDKETLLLKKFISPKTEQGVLSPSGGDKPNFYFLGSRER